MIRATFLLLITGLILGYSALRFGSVVTADWNICVLALGTALLIGYFPLGRGAVSAPVNRLLCFALFAIPLWALAQTIPLPVAWASILSPERAALAKPLLRFAPVPSGLSLSIRPEETLRYALRYFAYGAMFLVARDLMWRMPDRQWLIALPVLLVAMAEAAIGLIQNATGNPNTQVSGTFVNRSHFCAMLEMALPFAICMIFNFAPRGVRALAACAGAGIAALLFAGIAASLSRGGFLVALFSVACVTVLNVIRKSRGAGRIFLLFGAIVTIGAGGVFLVSGRLLERISSASAGELPLADRVLFWRETLRVIAAYPLTGCGFGGFVSAVTPYRASSLLRTLDYSHNDYLQFAAEGGLIALIPALIVGAFLARTLWRALVSQTFRRRGQFAIACASALCAGLLHSGVDLITYVPATGLLVCWIAGIVAGLEFGESRWFPASRPSTH